MPFHPRQQLREAMQTQLLGKTAAGARVFRARVLPFRKVELPALVIYSTTETTEPTSRASAPRELQRTVQLVVEGAVRQAEEVDDALDALAVEVEEAVNADETLGGKASDTLLVSTDLEVMEDGDRLIGVVRLTYEATYYNRVTVAGQPPDDFERANIRYSLGGDVHPDDQAEDDVAVPT